MLGTAALLTAVAPAATGSRGTRAHPYPVRTAVQLPKGKGWLLKVNSSVPDGTKLVLDASKSNFPPRRGQQYFLINVTMTYRGPGSDSAFSAYDLTAVGPTGLTYTRVNDDCGTPPHALDDFKKLASGRRITGNVCFSVLSADARGIVLKCVPTASKSTHLYFKVR